MRVSVRAAQPGDSEGLARAARDLAEQYAELDAERFHVPDEAAVVAWYEDALARPLPETSVWLVAEVDGEAIGEAQAVVQEPLVNAAVQPQRDVGRLRVYLNYLAVQAAHQSRGAGGRLVEGVEEWGRERGAELIVTDTNLRSDGAVRFYEKQGFEQRSVVLRKPLA
jgi:GNAT superfamily N-acetyltransferase